MHIYVYIGKYVEALAHTAATAHAHILRDGEPRWSPFVSAADTCGASDRILRQLHAVKCTCTQCRSRVYAIEPLLYVFSVDRLLLYCVT